MSRVRISLDLSNSNIAYGKGSLTASHLRTLVQVLFISAMTSEHHHKTDLKAHHLKSAAKRDKSLSLQGRFLVAHDWHSMTICHSKHG
jgi:hypothetical protein